MKRKNLIIIAIIICILLTFFYIINRRSKNDIESILDYPSKRWLYIDSLPLPKNHKLRLKKDLVRIVWETAVLEKEKIPIPDIEKFVIYADNFYKHNPNTNITLYELIKNLSK